VLAAYGATGFVLVRGLAVRQSERRAYRLAADAVVGLAADLRAGSALAPAWQAAQDILGRASAGILPGWRSARRDDGPGPRAAAAATGEAAARVAEPAAVAWDVPGHAPAAHGPPDGRPDGVTVVVRRVVAAMALAQACGAPLADVLDRLDAHLRAVDRTRSVASSQAAGARVSAGLLAAMPVAGVGLGAVVGVDAWEVLLRTPAGALALFLAVALQLGGLAWAARLAAPEASL
jgi:tight adherence protein B